MVFNFLEGGGACLRVYIKIFILNPNNEPIYTKLVDFERNRG